MCWTFVIPVSTCPSRSVARDDKNKGFGRGPCGCAQGQALKVRSTYSHCGTALTWVHQALCRRQLVIQIADGEHGLAAQPDIGDRLVKYRRSEEHTSELQSLR